jgi:hypothetical protein
MPGCTNCGRVGDACAFTPFVAGTCQVGIMGLIVAAALVLLRWSTGGGREVSSTVHDRRRAAEG